MSVIGMLVHARTEGADLTVFVAVPAVLWGISVAACVVTRRWRTRTFVAAVALGGLGLFIGVYGQIDRPQAAVGVSHGEACMSCLGAAVLILYGSLLLVVGALLGFVALFLRQRPWGQPRSEDSVDSSGPGDQESDV